MLSFSVRPKGNDYLGRTKALQTISETVTRNLKLRATVSLKDVP